MDTGAFFHDYNSYSSIFSQVFHPEWIWTKDGFFPTWTDFSLKQEFSARYLFFVVSVEEKEKDWTRPEIQMMQNVATGRARPVHKLLHFSEKISTQKHFHKQERFPKVNGKKNLIN